MIDAFLTLGLWGWLVILAAPIVSLWPALNTPDAVTQVTAGLQTARLAAVRTGQPVTVVLTAHQVLWDGGQVTLDPPARLAPRQAFTFTPIGRLQEFSGTPLAIDVWDQPSRPPTRLWLTFAGFVRGAQ